MPMTVIMASPSSTVRKMVGISLANLPCELAMVNSGAKLIQHLSTAKPNLVLISEDLAGSETATIIEQMMYGSSSKSISTIVLRKRKSSFDIARTGASVDLAYIDMPASSQFIVEAVCQGLGLDVPDERLYTPYRVSIPLASSGHAVPTAQASLNPPAQDDDKPVPQTATNTDSTPPDEIISSSPVSETEAEDDLDHMATHAEFKSMRPPYKEEHVEDVSEAGLMDESYVEDAVVIETSSFGVLETVGQDTTKVDGVIETVTDAVANRLISPTTEETAEIQAVARDVIEQVVWEVVPELAEALIKEEIARLLNAGQH